MECRKYELNKDKISDFLDDLINLDDWIPFEVNLNHPPFIMIRFKMPKINLH